MDLAAPPPLESSAATTAGLRFGTGGVHTSRTMMLAELTAVLAAAPANADRERYADAIIIDNVLHKSTASNRRLTNQRLGEFYSLDRRIQIFRALRSLWDLDEAGRPVLAVLCALARDPLLRLTAQHVLALPLGAELVRSEFLQYMREHVDARLNDASLDKVVRNAGSSWTQSGHLAGRMRKVRVAVGASFGPVTFAIWLGSLEGLVGESLLRSFWMSVFDAPRYGLIDAVMQAKQRGLLGASIVADVVQMDVAPFCHRIAFV
jgi:hypothetical protein